MRNYLIIGANSAIGKAIVKNLNQDGNTIYGTWHKNEPDLSGDQIHLHQFDGSEGNIDLNFLPNELHGVVYCPGSINLKPFNRFEPKDFIDDFNFQVVGAVKVIQAALPKLKKADQSSVVFFSTVAVQQGFNFHAQVAASKGAIEGLTRSLAAELSPKIRVNAVAPSLINAPLRKIR